MTTTICIWLIFFLQENRWTELSIQLPDKTRLLSDGVREDVLYGLVNNNSNFYEINLRTNSCSTRAANSSNYSLGGNGEAYLLRTAPDDFVVFAASYSSTNWYAYSYKNNKWSALSSWSSSSSETVYFFFDPVTFRIFRHINGKSNWETIDMRPARV